MDNSIAWAAGLFEGEGCFTASRNKSGNIQIRATLNMTDQEVVASFREAVGIGTIYPGSVALPHHNPRWIWRASGEDAERVYDLLHPWLHARRRARFAELREERKAYVARASHSSRSGPPPKLPKRYAVVHARSRAEAESFLPANYLVLTDHDADPYGNFKNCVIEGYDEGSFTLDGWIIPNYRAKGLTCREHADRNDAETVACSAMN